MDIINKDILVVTATLGKRESINKTIQSVNEVGGHRVAHVIISNLDTINQLKKSYPELIYIEEPIYSNTIYKALNYATQQEINRFKYFTFINDDDYWLPSFNKLINSLDSNADYDVAFGRVKYIDQNGEYLSNQTSTLRYKSFKYLLAGGIPMLTQQATLIRSEVFVKLNGFDESYKLIADTDFWLRAIDKGFHFKFVNIICAAYMIQSGQLSSDNKTQSKEHTILRKKYKLDSLNRFKIYYEILLFRIMNIRTYLKRLKTPEKIKMNSRFHK